MAVPAVTAQTIANRVDVERRYLGMRRVDVVRAAGVTTPTYYRLLHGGDATLGTLTLLLESVGLKLVIQRVKQ